MDVALQILQYNYWEHFKAAKDMSLILPIDHPRRIQIEHEMNSILAKINEIKKET